MPDRKRDRPRMVKEPIMENVTPNIGEDASRIMKALLRDAVPDLEKSDECIKAVDAAAAFMLRHGDYSTMAFACDVQDALNGGELP